MKATNAWLRAFAGLVAGAITAVAPFVFYWARDWHPLQVAGVPYFALLLAPAVAGGLVAVLVASGRPRWWLGAVLGALLGAIAAAFYFVKGGDVAQESWLQVLLSLCFAALAALAGGVGGLLGWGVARALAGGSRAHAARGRLPWRVGIALMVASALVFGVLAAVAGTR